MKISQTAKISEIFQSIQGEGPYTGVRQVFVRFFGCHMHCAWCDTPESIGDTSQKFKVMTGVEVLRNVEKLARACHSVSLTGGEPLLQVEFLEKWLPRLKKLKLKIYLETSGVLHKNLVRIIKDLDMISMDIKLPSSTGERSFWQEHEAFLKAAVKAKKEIFIKAVVTADTKQSDVIQAAKLVARIDRHLLLILQPDTFGIRRGAIEKGVEYQPLCQKILANTRVMMQMHKFMRIQ